MVNENSSYDRLAEGDFDRLQIDDLEALIADRPWFALAHMALAKRYFDVNHSGYADQLGKAAIHVGSPSILYDIIMDPQEVEAPELSEKEEIVSVEKQPVVEIEPEPQAVEKEVDMDNEGISVPMAEESPIEEAEVDEPQPIPEFDELQTNLVVEAISDSIEKEVTPQPVVQEKQDIVSTLDSSGLSSLSRWMLKRSEEVGFTAESSAFESAPQVSSNPQDLIDRFIQSSPKITPKKVDSYSTENLAKESLVEDESLITETMAKIYAQQGKMEKARKAYRLLSLKYPEKSVYFAAQLKKLGKKAN